MDAEIPVAAPNGSLRGRARLRLLSVKGFPVSQRSLPAVSQLPTDHVSMAEVSRRTRTLARPCPQDERTFTSSGAMYKYTAHPAVRRAVAGDCYAAKRCEG